MTVRLLRDYEAEERADRSLGDLFANLAYIREKRAITYGMLGTLSGMNERNAWMIVNGKQQPRYRSLLRLADALEIPAGDLALPRERFAAKYAKAKPFPPITLTREGNVVKRTSPQSHADLLERTPA